METLLKADIFFFVTTIAVVVLVIVLTVLLIYLILILRNIFYISDLVKKESDEVVKDISDLRNSIRIEAGKFKEDANSLSNSARAEGEGILKSIHLAHEAVKKDAEKLWGLFTFLLSFLTIKKASKVFKSKKKKKTYGKKTEQ